MNILNQISASILLLALSTAVAATTIGAGQPPLNDPKTVDCKKEILVVNPDGQPISGVNVTTSFEQNELETLTTNRKLSYSMKTGSRNCHMAQFIVQDSIKAMKRASSG